MFTLTYVDLENETSISIWEFEKMNVLKQYFCLLFSSLHNYIHRTEMKYFINVLWHINLYMNISISNWHNSIFGSPKMMFFTLFQFLSRLLTSNHLISLVHNSLGEMEWCEKRAFLLLKMWKMKVSRNIKTKCVTDFVLTVRSSSMKDYTCHYVGST